MSLTIQFFMDLVMVEQVVPVAMVLVVAARIVMMAMIMVKKPTAGPERTLGLV